ncbi:MAG TPA: hypothetical protein VE982_00885 [Gaiellaceae bacterium]|nr:hypothetical protein [Gaiellaceae bacterium]
MAHDVRRAVAARDAAATRVRRTTAALAVLGIGATVGFASLAAASTHLRKAVHVARRSAGPQAPVRAPAPPLVAVGGAAPAAPPAPAPAPAAVPQQPVVVSGGS